MVRFFYLLCSFILLWSCSVDDNSIDEINHTKAAEKVAVDLSPGGLNLAVAVLPEDAHSIKMKWNPTFGRMELTDGDGTDMFISEDTVGCSSKLADLENGIFDVEFLQASDTLIAYKTMLPDGSNAYFHFFASFYIDNKNFVFESNPLVEFSENQILHMIEMVKNFQAANDQNS